MARSLLIESSLSFGHPLFLLTLVIAVAGWWTTFIGRACSLLRGPKAADFLFLAAECVFEARCERIIPDHSPDSTARLGESATPQERFRSSFHSNPQLAIESTSARHDQLDTQLRFARI